MDNQNDVIGIRPRQVVAIVSIVLIAIVASLGKKPSAGGESASAMAIAAATSEPVITARLIDAKTGEPLPSATPPYIDNTQFYFERSPNQWELVAVVPTDINGTLVVQQRSDGKPLAPGNYILEAEGRYTHLLSWVPFILGSSDLNLGDIKLTPKPVIIKVLARSGIPSAGGNYSWSYQVVNTTNQTQRVAVSAILQGPSSLGTFFQNEVRSRSLMIHPQQIVNVKDSITIPTINFPSNLYPYCVHITVSGTNPFDIFDWTQFCDFKS